MISLQGDVILVCRIDVEYKRDFVIVESQPSPNHMALYDLIINIKTREETYYALDWHFCQITQ